MDFYSLIITLLVFLAFAVFSFKRLMTYLHALQQDDYDNGRLMKWIIKFNVFDKRLSFILLFLGFSTLLIPHAFGAFAVFFAFAAAVYIEEDPRKDSKKKLVVTARARRILMCSMGLALLVGIAAAAVNHPWGWIIAVQTLPLLLVMGNYMLAPLEHNVNRKYLEEAQTKVRALNPTIIAITGSYGKTSVKHILGHILSTQAPTLVTPGSTNTEMGTTRIIREQLDESHKYFVVEMGAYGKGSINRLCKLTPPDLGIITAIGHAHYERFKTLENVAEAKFELAESVISQGGKTIIHEKTLDFEYPRQLVGSRMKDFVICYDDSNEDKQNRRIPDEHLQIRSIHQTPDGLKVSVDYDGIKAVLDVPLYGIHHGYNVAVAYAAARQLGIDPAAIKTALKSLKQITHRLEVKHQPDGTIIIDDAFNSNPRGFRAALDLLAVLGEDAKSKGKEHRKILITPGMVEMGGAHDDVHEKIGRTAGRICDIAIVVNGARIPGFIKGFKSTGVNSELLKRDRFTDAAKWLNDNKKVGDIVLIENDLPDLYERIPRI